MSRLLFSFKWSWVVNVADVAMPASAVPDEEDVHTVGGDGGVEPVEATNISDEEGLELIGESRESAFLRSLS
jgi:hypothetical protein